MALEQLIDAHCSCVYQLVSLILRGLADPGTVEECCSDVFMSVWEKREQFDPRRSSLRTWVLILARYRALDYRRKLGRRQHREEIDSHDAEAVASAANTATGNYPEACCLQNEQRTAIISALNSLPESDREILYRRYFLDEPVGVIAVRLGVTRGAADNRLWRARKALKDRLIESGEKEVTPCNE